MRDMDVCKDRRFDKYEHMWFGDMRFGYRRFVRFEHSYTTAFRGLVQIVRRKSQTLRYSQTSIAPYHGYKGLSTMPNLAGNREDTFDTKHSIYKHYIPDMRICGYKGLI